MAERTERFVRNTTILLREVRGGPPGTAIFAYSGLAVVVAIFITLIAVTARRVPPPDGPGDRPVSNATLEQWRYNIAHASR